MAVLARGSALEVRGAGGREKTAESSSLVGSVSYQTPHSKGGYSLCTMYHIYWLIAMILFHPFGVRVTRQCPVSLKQGLKQLKKCNSVFPFLDRQDRVVPGGAGEADLLVHGRESSGDPVQNNLYDPSSHFTELLGGHV